MNAERVRQLLVRGGELGLYTYPPPPPPVPNLGEFRDACRMGYSKTAVARRFGLSFGTLNALGRRYGMNWVVVRAQMRERRRLDCLAQMRRLARRLGHTPTTAELDARGLMKSIARYCGSLLEARLAAGLAPPPPMTEAAWRGMRRRDERRHRTRDRRLAPMLQVLADGPVRLSELARRLRMRSPRIAYYLRVLRAEGRATRIVTHAGPRWVLRVPARPPRGPGRRRTKKD